MLSFASEAKDIVDITDTEISGSADDVIWRLMNFDYNSRTMLASSTFTHWTPIKIMFFFFIRFEFPAFQGFIFLQAMGAKRELISTPHCIVLMR